MDARHLPGSWSSTANALECQAFYAANAAFAVDDFVPTGTSYQAKQYQASADKLIRAQGNQGGRARLTDVSTLQQTFFPRGVILSTGEDIPQGHSVRARMIIMEASPGDVKLDALTIAQKNRSLYSTLLASLIQELAAHPDDIENEVMTLRDQNLDIGHSRTPQMVARLIVVIRHFLQWAARKGLTKQPKAITDKLEDAIAEVAMKQGSYLEASDPMEIFLSSLRMVFGIGKGHIRSLNGGIPARADTIGWTDSKGAGEMATWRAHGPCLGWIDWQNDEMLLEHNIGIAAAITASQGELQMTKGTLLKRMKESALLKRTDETRQRTTVRITADGHPQTVIVLRASQVLQIAELPA